MNKDKKFDELIKSKLDNDEVLFQPKGWEQMQQAITAQNANKKNQKLTLVTLFYSWKSITAIASCAIILLGVFMFSLQKGNETIPSTQNQYSSNKNIEKANIEQSDKKENTANPNTKIEYISILSHTNKRSNKSIDHQEVPFDTKGLLKTNIIESEEGLIATRKEDKIKAPIGKDTLQMSAQEVDFLLKQYITKGFEEEGTKKENISKEGFEIGINGGINYGTLNQGYAMGVVAKTNLSKDVFIDGSIGVNFSNKTDVPVYSVSSNKVLARPGKNQSPINSPAITDQSNQLVYLQFNPSVGYQVAKNISFSIGGDIQQQINRKNKTEENVVYYGKDQNAAIIPSSDFGFTTKTEFKISKSINAGLLYREGLNNYFATADNGVNYANRRYVQIQLKYNIPL